MIDKFFALVCLFSILMAVVKIMFYMMATVYVDVHKPVKKRTKRRKSRYITLKDTEQKTYNV